MQHDDYDPHAFQELLPVLTAHQARVMNCSIPGRHNDDSPTIASWFVNFTTLFWKTSLGEFNMLKTKHLKLLGIIFHKLHLCMALKYHFQMVK